MTQVRLYAALAVLGTVLPLAQFVPWLAAHGLDMRLFAEQLFANRIGGFFAMDVLVSAIVVIVLVRGEGRDVPGGWLAIPATLLVGVSCGLPLFLMLRARANI